MKSVLFLALWFAVMSIVFSVKAADNIIAPNNSGKAYLQGNDGKLYPAVVAFTTDGNSNLLPMPGTGTVTSVDLSMPDIFDVTGNPVTESGSLDVSFVDVASNLVLAGPAAVGSPAAPEFRALVELDIPDLSSSKISDFQTSVSANADVIAAVAGIHSPVAIATPNGLSILGQALSLALADTSNTGALSSTDWNTFNNKMDSVTVNAPIVATAGVISIPAASSSVDGYLAQADWSSFNAKEDAVNKGVANGYAPLDLSSIVPMTNLPNNFSTIIPQDGYVLPISASRAYFGTVLYSATAIYNNGSTNYSYLALYGNGTATSVAYSNDGITWTSEQTMTGISAGGYHGSYVLVGTTLHMFYWGGTTIYSAGSNRHATIDITTNCSVAVTDGALSGDYITGNSGDGLRYGTYGVYAIFHNASPTDNPADPYSYTWTAIHSGTTGGIEGILFATSTDGTGFSAWGGSTEVISRSAYPAWDVHIGAVTVWKVGSEWNMYYSGGVGTSNGADSNFADGLGYASSSDGITWKKYSSPVLFKTYALKAAKRLYTPSVIQDQDGYKLYFTAKNNAGVYRMIRASLPTMR